MAPLVDLRALARERGIRRKSVTLPVIRTTQAQTDALARRMVAVVDIWVASARDVLLPEYARTLTTDSIPDLEAQIAATDARAVRATLDFGQWFRGWAADLSEWHLRKILDAIFSQLRIDLRPFASAINDPAVIEAALARNVALVRSVSDDTRAKIADAIFRGQQAGTSTADVTREISEVLGKSKDRARRIATDQTAKLGATLDQQRQEALGFTEFEWVHSLKIHYRPEHKARDGKVYNWRENDLDGDLPGVAPFCGCKAKAYLSLGDPVVAAPPVRRAVQPRPETAAQRNARLDVEQRDYVLTNGRRDGVEFMTAIDVKTGGVFGRNVGTQGNVTFTDEFMAALKDARREVVAHHNHPSSSTFSRQDIMVLGESPGLKGLWAHGHDGSSYYAERGRYAIGPKAYDEVKRAATTVLSRLIRAGRITEDDLNTNGLYQHVVTMALARKNRLKYEFTLSPARQAHFDKFADVIETALGAI